MNISSLCFLIIFKYFTIILNGIIYNNIIVSHHTSTLSNIVRNTLSIFNLRVIRWFWQFFGKIWKEGLQNDTVNRNLSFKISCTVPYRSKYVWYGRLTSDKLLLDRMDSVNDQNNKKIAQVIKLDHISSKYMFFIF